MDVVQIVFDLFGSLRSRPLVNEEDAEAEDDGADESEHATGNLLFAFKRVHVSI